MKLTLLGMIAVVVAIVVIVLVVSQVWNTALSRP